MSKTVDNKVKIIIGRVAKMIEEGYSNSEIMKKLKLPESTLRCYLDIIDKAKANRNK